MKVSQINADTQLANRVQSDGGSRCTGKLLTIIIIIFEHFNDAFHYTYAMSQLMLFFLSSLFFVAGKKPICADRLLSLSLSEFNFAVVIN